MRRQVRASCRLIAGSVVGGCLLLAALLATAHEASAQVASTQADPSHVASSIAVEGNRRIDADTIRSHVKTRPGAQLDAAGLDAALKALYATGLFQDVRIDRSGDRVIVTVVENPLIYRIAFEGNKKIKDDQLKTELQSKDRGTLSRPTVQSDVIRIVDVYHRSGYFNVRVEPKFIGLPNARVDLVFEIKEGEKTGVKDIVFVGNKAYSSLRLKQVIRSGVTNALSFLLNNDIYDPDRVESDRELLRRFYLKQGYADVRIVSAVANFDPGHKGFVVTFTIDEGSPYRIGTVDINSNLRTVDLKALRSKLRTIAGAVYNVEAVEKTVEGLSIELARQSYPFASVRPRADRNAQSHVINLVYAVEEGARTYVERINIRGNTKTRDHVIRREFEIAEGDAFSRALIDRAERRLKNLGFFKTVKISSEHGSAPDRIIVNVDVEDQSTGEFSVAGGYSTVDGLLAEVSIGERNFLGRGEYIKAAVTYGQYTKGFTVGFAEPYFLGSRVSLGIDVFAKQTTSSAYQSFGSETYGSTITAGTALTEQLGIQWRYSIYRQSTSLDPALMDCAPGNPPPGCYANGEASVPTKQAALNGPAWVSAIGYTLTYSTLDNNKNPTSGFRSDFRQDLAGLGGDVKFLKSTEDLRYYHEIAKDIVGLARTQSGYVTPWGGQQLPLVNGFFGGPQLVRGFAPNGFGPRDTTAGTTMDSLGGSMYWATTAELRTPVPWLPPEFGLKMALFADAGSLWGYRGTTGPALSQSLQVSDAKVIRSSFGAGLIWDSPLGPLRVDYAYPTSKASYDVTQRFRFSAGAF